jgi:hypothetical protein
MTSNFEFDKITKKLVEDLFIKYENSFNISNYKFEDKTKNKKIINKICKKIPDSNTTLLCPRIISYLCRKNDNMNYSS